jgi:hypothetical protein
MHRREFLEAIAGFSALVPGLALGLDPEGFARDAHARAQAAAGLRTLTAAQDATLGCIADILLPQTDTPGAMAVGVDRFIDLILTESMLARDRDRFLQGLAAIDARSRSLYGAPLGSARREQQESLVRALDGQLPEPALTKTAAEARERAPVSALAGYRALKGLVLLGYFTAEPVAKQLLSTDPIIPGRYDGCVHI